MKKIYNVALAFVSCAVAGTANAASDGQFKSEILKGLNSVRTQYTYVPETTYTATVVDTTTYDDAGYGELGREVFYDMPSDADDSDYELFIPTSMYVRVGGGINFGLATKKARVADETFQSRGSWNATIGLGWNMSSYVRTEIAFQESTFEFKDLSDMTASYHTLNGMLYFDFLRRYVQSGDITYRRVFVPFMGLGAGLGAYNFVGAHGAGGFVVAAPRAELGMNFMLNEMVGIDLAYQYQMFLGHGFGWNTKRAGVDGISNIMATIRVNF